MNFDSWWQRYHNDVGSKGSIKDFARRAFTLGYRQGWHTGLTAGAKRAQAVSDSGVQQVIKFKSVRLDMILEDEYGKHFRVEALSRKAGRLMLRHHDEKDKGSIWEKADFDRCWWRQVA